MSVQRLILLAALAGALAGALFVAFQWNPSRPPEESPLRSRGSMDLSPTPEPLGSLMAPSNPKATPQAHLVVRESAEKSWSGFRERFGRELRAEFLKDGRLSAVRGAPGSGERAGADFNPADPQKVAARAREILQASRELLGLNPEFPLEGPKAVPGAASAQVIFRETYDGIPVAPFGAVTMDFGSQGELLALESSYLPSIQVINAPKITEDQARAKASVSSRDPVESGMKVEGGSRVVWVTAPAPEGKPSTARHVYEYSVKGQQILIDAGSGEVVSRRDRRHF